MTHPAPLYASERTAARLLDMAPAAFRALVERGALPPPRPIGDHLRWRVADLEAIIEGRASLPTEELDL